MLSGGVECMCKLIRKRTSPVSAYSWILAKISESLKRKYSSSPSLIEFPPHPGRSTLSPVLTAVGTILPSLSGAPGPTAITVASGKGLLVDDWGRKMPEVVVVLGLNL